jgi:DNA-binding LacI/PurR family transcriptional regulator
MLAVFARLDQNTEMAELLPHITAITLEARKHDYNMMLVPAEEGIEALQRLAGQSLADAIIMFDIEMHDERLAPASRLGIPVVMVGNPLESGGLSGVDVDYRQAPRMLVDELVACGVDHIIAIGHAAREHHRYWFDEMYEQQTTDAARRHGVDFRFFRPKSSSWQALDPLRAILQERGIRDRYGIALRTPFEAERIMQLVTSMGLRPGRDVQIVAICEDSVAASMVVPVTNVSPEAQTVATDAARLAFELLDGQKADGGVRLVEPRLTRRETTRLASAG